jgi:hypothetical protein
MNDVDRSIDRVAKKATEHLTAASGSASNHSELTTSGKVRYEVEHIWTDHPDRHVEKSAHDAEFARHRNRIGDLLLLPKSFNASYNDDPQEMKLPHYFGQNVAAASLNPLSYEKNPGFIAFTKSSGLPFTPHREFKAADVVERGNLYRDIAKQVWNPDDLLQSIAGAY